jgi:large subunit ribosomal protein L23
MEVHEVIKRPLITEKSTWQSQRSSKASGGAYAFEVHPKANKYQIKDAIEKIYEVKVVEVRTSNRRGKPRKFRYHKGNTPNWKKAVVVLHADDHIDLF